MSLVPEIYCKSGANLLQLPPELSIPEMYPGLPVKIRLSQKTKR